MFVSNVDAAGVQAVRLRYDGDSGRLLSLHAAGSVPVRQAARHVHEHVLDAAPGRRRHRVRRVHAD